MAALVAAQVTYNREIKALREQLQDVVDEKEEYKEHLSPATSEGGTRRSSKLPDPPILTDGKNPKFED